MWLNGFLIASGVEIHARKEGVLYDEIGRIVVSPASPHGVDEHLWACLRIAVDQLGLVIGLHAPHPDKGRVVVIHRIGKEGGAWRPATLANPEAIRLMEYLRLHGFHAGADGEDPALRLGPPHTALNPTPGDHAQQLVVSLPRNSAPGTGNGTGSGERAGSPLQGVSDAQRAVEHGVSRGGRGVRPAGGGSKGVAEAIDERMQ